MQAFKIGSRDVGAGKAFVIAEIGSNHDRDPDVAKRLIEQAAKAGADAVKFQLFKATDLYPQDSPAYPAVKECELPEEWLPELKESCSGQGVEFLGSFFRREAVDILCDLGVPALKIASSETTNLPLLKFAASKAKPLLISTGMCDLSDVFEAVHVARSAGSGEIALLQCTSLYPTEPGQVHLRAMRTLAEAFSLPVGFSDHSESTAIPCAAVALGASVIEKHLTLDRESPGPDHAYALEPREFSEMVKGIRETEQALGSPEKAFLAAERRLARRASLRAARDIAAGQIIGDEDVAISRPADGIRPRFLQAVKGQVAARDIASGEPLAWDSLEEAQ